MKIGQLVFHTMDEIPLNPYWKVGRYNNDKGATASKG